MSLTLPLAMPTRSVSRKGTITATVLKMGVGLKPVTVEVVTAFGDQVTIWNLGYMLGQTVELERRGSGDAAYLADVNDCGGPRYR